MCFKTFFTSLRIFFILANHLKSKRATLFLNRQQTSEAINQFESLQLQDYCDTNIRLDMGHYDYIKGINIRCNIKYIFDPYYLS